MEKNIDLQKIYIKKYESEDHYMLTEDDINQMFNKIEAFYRRQDDICDNKIENSTIQSDDKLEAPKCKEDDNIYFSTDHHGDLSAFMFSLLRSGVARFKEGGPSTLYFDMNSGTIVENVEEYIEKNETIGLVPIPNLEINSEFNGKFICGGDLIDRGKETDSCFCLMYYLLNQKGAENKIEYIVGNHEEMIFKENQQHYNGNNFDLTKKCLVELVKNNKMKFVCCSGQTVFSHTVFTKEQILLALDIIIENKDDYFDIEQGKGNFGKGIKNKALELKQKINEDKKLNEEDIQLLIDVLNDLFVKKVESLNGYELEDNIFCIDGRFGRGLLWQRDIYEQQKINGLYQVVGHCPETNHKPKLENKIIRADAYQSSGYNYGDSVAVMLNFKNNKCSVERRDIIKLLIEEKSKENYKKPISKKERIKSRLDEFCQKHGLINPDNFNNFFKINRNFDKEYRREYGISIFDELSEVYPDKKDEYEYLKSKINSLNFLIDSDIINKDEAVKFYKDNIFKDNVILKEQCSDEFIENTILPFFENTLSKKNKTINEMNNIFNEIANIYNFDERQKKKFGNYFRRHMFCHLNGLDGCKKDYALFFTVDTDFDKKYREIYGISILDEVSEVHPDLKNKCEHLKSKINSLNFLIELGILDKKNAIDFYKSNVIPGRSCDNKFIIEKVLPFFANVVVNKNADEILINTIFDNIAIVYSFNHSTNLQFYKNLYIGNIKKIQNNFPQPIQGQPMQLNQQQLQNQMYNYQTNQQRYQPIQGQLGQPMNPINQNNISQQMNQTNTQYQQQGMLGQPVQINTPQTNTPQPLNGTRINPSQPNISGVGYQSYNSNNFLQQNYQQGQRYNQQAMQYLQTQPIQGQPMQPMQPMQQQMHNQRQQELNAQLNQANQDTQWQNKSFLQNPLYTNK